MGLPEDIRKKLGAMGEDVAQRVQLELNRRDETIRELEEEVADLKTDSRQVTDVLRPAHAVVDIAEGVRLGTHDLAEMDEPLTLLRAVSG